jgi:uncharacterized membrane protein
VKKKPAEQRRTQSFSQRIRQRVKTSFFAGLLILLPAVVSIKVFLWLLTYVDNFLRPLLEEFVGPYFFGVGIVLIVGVTLIVGLLAQNYLGRRLVRLVEMIFDRLPFIRTVYSVVRQLIEPFSSEGGRSFRQVVMVEYPMKGRYAIGFVANENAGQKGKDSFVTVFLPSNHLHLGYLVVMPAKDVIPLDYSVEEALKMIVSCGIVIPRKLDIKTAPGGIEKRPNADAG